MNILSKASFLGAVFAIGMISTANAAAGLPINVSEYCRSGSMTNPVCVTGWLTVARGTTVRWTADQWGKTEDLVFRQGNPTVTLKNEHKILVKKSLQGGSSENFRVFYGNHLQLKVEGSPIRPTATRTNYVTGLLQRL